MNERLSGISAGVSVEIHGNHAGIGVSAPDLKDINEDFDVTDYISVEHGGEIGATYAGQASVVIAWRVGDREDPKTWNYHLHNYIEKVNDYIQNHPNEILIIEKHQYWNYFFVRRYNHGDEEWLYFNADDEPQWMFIPKRGRK